MKRGLTQADLGGDLVTPSMISQIEADRARPSYPLLTELANRLGVPVEFFMNDMDHQFLFAAQLSLSMYEATIGRPEEAMAGLAHVPQTRAQGLNQQEFLYISAHTCRLMKQFPKATAQLEQLRETAYRTQDERLLFLVLRESGYIEFDLENWDGALHEWERAVEVGHRLSQRDELPRLDMNVMLADVLLQLDRLTHDKIEMHPSKDYLKQAQSMVMTTPDILSITEQLVKDAHTYLATDPAKSKVLADKANTLLTFARLIEQVMTVQSRLDEVTGNLSADPWQQAAFSMTSVYPEMFLTSACDQIDNLIQRGEFDSARARIQHVRGVLGLLRVSPPPHLHQDIGLRLELQDIQMEERSGHRDESIARLEQYIDTFPEGANIDYQIKACALLVLWFGENRDTENTLRYCKKMEHLMSIHSPGTPLFM